MSRFFIFFNREASVAILAQGLKTGAPLRATVAPGAGQCSSSVWVPVFFVLVLYVYGKARAGVDLFVFSQLAAPSLFFETFCGLAPVDLFLLFGLFSHVSAVVDAYAYAFCAISCSFASSLRCLLVQTKDFGKISRSVAECSQVAQEAVVMNKTTLRSVKGLTTAVEALASGLQDSNANIFRELKDHRWTLMGLRGKLESLNADSREAASGRQVVSGQYLAREPLSPDVNDDEIGQLLERLFSESVSKVDPSYSQEEVLRSQSQGSSSHPRYSHDPVLTEAALQVLEPKEMEVAFATGKLQPSRKARILGLLRRANCISAVLTAVRPKLDAFTSLLASYEHRKVSREIFDGAVELVEAWKSSGDSPYLTELGLPLSRHPGFPAPRGARKRFYSVYFAGLLRRLHDGDEEAVRICKVLLHGTRSRPVPFQKSSPIIASSVAPQRSLEKFWRAEFLVLRIWLPLHRPSRFR